MNNAKIELTSLINPRNSFHTTVFVVSTLFTDSKWLPLSLEMFASQRAWLFVATYRPKDGWKDPWGYIYLPVAMSRGGIPRELCSFDLPLPLRLLSHEKWLYESPPFHQLSLPDALIMLRLAYERIRFYLGQDDLKGDLLSRLGEFFQRGHLLAEWHKELFVMLHIVPSLLVARHSNIHHLSAVELDTLVNRRIVRCETALFKQRMSTCWVYEIYEICLTLRASLCPDYEPLEIKEISSMMEMSLPNHLTPRVCLTVPFELATEVIGTRRCLLRQGHAILNYEGMLNCAPSWFALMLKKRLSLIKHDASFLIDERFQGAIKAIRRLFDQKDLVKQANPSRLKDFQLKAPPCARQMLLAYERDTLHPLQRKTQGAKTLHYSNRVLTLNVLSHCGLQSDDLLSVVDTRIDRCFTLPNERVREKQEARSFVKSSSSKTCAGCFKIGSAGWCPFVNDMEELPQLQCAKQAGRTVRTENAQQYTLFR